MGREAVKRKPLGLKKAADSKRARNERDEDQQTVMLEGEFADDDEMGYLAALHAKAGAALASEPWSAKALYNGVVHEADRMLKKDTEDQLPAKFHLIYASALFSLAAFAEDATGETQEDFLDYATDRALLGLGKGSEDGVLNILIAKARIAKAEYIMSKHAELGRQEAFDLVQEALKYMDKGLAARAQNVVEHFDCLLQILRFASEGEPSMCDGLCNWVEEKCSVLQNENDRYVSFWRLAKACIALTKAECIMEKSDVGPDGQLPEETVGPVKQYCEDALSACDGLLEGLGKQEIAVKQDILRTKSSALEMLSRLLQGKEPSSAEKYLSRAMAIIEELEGEKAALPEWYTEYEEDGGDDEEETGLDEGVSTE